MPIYEYQCRRCQNRFELKRAFSDNGSVASCPKCQGEADRLFTPVPIIFKGSGFYITDSRKPEATESADGSKESLKESSKEESTAAKGKD